MLHKVGGLNENFDVGVCAETERYLQHFFLMMFPRIISALWKKKTPTIIRYETKDTKHRRDETTQISISVAACERERYLPQYLHEHLIKNHGQRSIKQK